MSTWTNSKHELIKKVISIMESGLHEYFTSHFRIHGEYVGFYYVESQDHKRKGTLEKYRGKKIMVLCCKRLKLSIRQYIVSVIED